MSSEFKEVDTPPIYTVQVLSSIKHEVMLVSAVNAEQAWVAEQGDNTLQLISSTGKVLKTQQTDFEIFDFTITPSGSLYVTADDGKDVKLLNKDSNDFVKIIDTGPESTLRLYTYGVCISKNGEILVGLFRKGESKVVRFSTSGEILQTIQYHSDGKTHLFYHPMFLVENIVNGDICVNDFFSRLTVVDKFGNLRFKYTGPKTDAKEKKCTFGYIQTDRLGNILICDNDASTVHILDQDGNFLQYLLTSKNGLEKPVGMSIDNSDNLWICHGDQSNKHIMIIKYIHE